MEARLTIDCFDGGEVLVCSLQRIAETWAFHLLSCTVADRRGTATTFKAVCGTQTRMPRGFKSMFNQIHALFAPTDNMAGEVLRNRSYRMLSTADQITRKRGKV